MTLSQDQVNHEMEDAVSQLVENARRADDVPPEISVEALGYALVSAIRRLPDECRGATRAVVALAIEIG